MVALPVIVPTYLSVLLLVSDVTDCCKVVMLPSAVLTLVVTELMLPALVEIWPTSVDVIPELIAAT